MSNTVTIGNWTGDLDVAANLMDDEIREGLHTQSDDWTEQAFCDAYCEAHLAKYGTPFAVN